MANTRLDREKRTVAAMIEIYCHARHRPVDGLCTECEQLYSYAIERIDKCPFKQDKPTCAKCAVHCYKPEMREKVRQVMRYAGPRMLLMHPVLSLRHYMDEFKHSRKNKSRGRNTSPKR